MLVKLVVAIASSWINRLQVWIHNKYAKNVQFYMSLRLLPLAVSSAKNQRWEGPTGTRTVWETSEVWGTITTLSTRPTGATESESLLLIMDKTLYLRMPEVLHMRVKKMTVFTSRDQNRNARSPCWCQLYAAVRRLQLLGGKHHGASPFQEQAGDLCASFSYWKMPLPLREVQEDLDTVWKRCTNENWIQVLKDYLHLEKENSAIPESWGS